MARIRTMVEVSTQLTSVPVQVTRRRPFYFSLSAQVVIAVILAVIAGSFFPTAAAAMKPLGDAYIRLITMLITLIVFCTVVAGIAGMSDFKKVGRIGGKALLYFEVVSTLALIIGLVVGMWCVREADSTLIRTR